MKTIKEILTCVESCMAADICDAAHRWCCYGDTDPSTCVDRLEADYQAILDVVKKVETLDRLREMVEAEREGRCVVLPSRNDEIVHAIETTLRIKLHDWQKAYIFQASDYLMPGRRTGRTTAYVLRLLLTKGEPLRLFDREELRKVCDEYHGEQYYDWFANFLRELHYELSRPGLCLNIRKIYFTRKEADAALKGAEHD